MSLKIVVSTLGGGTNIITETAVISLNIYPERDN